MSQAPAGVGAAVLTGNTRLIPIASVRTDGQTQHRIATSQALVAKYAELMRDGVIFPPVRVWWDGAEYWLTDGFHRLAAAQGLGMQEILAEIHNGTLAAAQWDSYAA